MNFLVGYGEVNMILLICKELDLSNIRSDIIVYPTFLNIYYFLESIILINFKEVMYMSANVETMFYTREKPWHGLGTRVEEALDSREALRLAGLDWRVVRKFNLWRDRW